MGLIEKASVVVIDRYPISREGIRAVLSRGDRFRVIAEASTVQDDSLPDESLRGSFVIVGLDPRDRSEVHEMRELVRAGAAGVIVYSLPEHLGGAGAALQGGAQAVVNRAGPVSELIDALHRVADGFYVSRCDLSGANSERAVEGVSPRQAQVLRLLMDGKSVREIASLLEMATKTVANYQSQLRRRFRSNNNITLLSAVRESGLIK